jgi:hypothetical protein
MGISGNTLLARGQTAGSRSCKSLDDVCWPTLFCPFICVPQETHLRVMIKQKLVRQLLRAPSGSVTRPPAASAAPGRQARVDSARGTPCPARSVLSYSTQA